MSKYGTIKVNVSKNFTSDQLAAFAEEQGITYDQAESLAKELLYRKAYAKLRNQDPEVKAQRKEASHKRQALLKALR